MDDLSEDHQLSHHMVEKLEVFLSYGHMMLRGYYGKYQDWISVV